MRTIAITVRVPIDKLADEVALEIARKAFADRQSYVGIPELDDAITDVIKATDRLDRDQMTRGEHAAIQGLFKAAKQLRLAARQSKLPNSIKGKSNG